MQSAAPVGDSLEPSEAKAVSSVKRGSKELKKNGIDDPRWEFDQKVRTPGQKTRFQQQVIPVPSAQCEQQESFSDSDFVSQEDSDDDQIMSQVGIRYKKPDQGGRRLNRESRSHRLLCCDGYK